MKATIVAALERIATRKNSAGAGAFGATALLSKFFGISLVAHSSGGVILTAGSGYIAGTFISAFVVSAFWILLPIAVIVGGVIWFRKQLTNALRALGTRLVSRRK
ncbi:hypothetical protein [Parasedimentitalea psychrophila]|uniref:Uncharacterized protein n=1 Tax=Parasedimentitalea psychrophila TaxID=2997337 RepID=A0A9Y2L592_9RHOB|nr:hypothetical protein [Parasedimentitalea psychrophila]WIY27169.1 hypothetical protein QPJ95_09770 [Parasedimentitalea psychrophila]